jgi:hypothetical protein
MIYHQIFNLKRRKFDGLISKKILFICTRKRVDFPRKSKIFLLFFFYSVGFVVGQTEQDWQRMSDDYDPSQKLNQYKYI